MVKILSLNFSLHSSYIDILETADLSDELQFVYLTPWSNEDCKFLYGSQLSEHMVCASGNYNEGFCLVGR